MKKKLQTKFSTRQYMLADDFEIYYYNDSYFSRVKSHTHDYYEFYIFLEGNITQHINKTIRHLQPRDVLVIPPDVPHYVTSLDPEQTYRRFVFWISRDYFQQLKEISPSYTYIMELAEERGYCHLHYDLISFNSLQAMIFELIEEMHSERFGKEEKKRLCVNDLILHLNRTIYELEHPKSLTDSNDLYENLIHYIDGHLDEDLTLDHIADTFYVSKYHIAHLFKNQLGLPIHQYITKKRLAKCRDAILGNTSISKAYLLYGFKDYSSFFRAFRKEYGMSPKEYKELHFISTQKLIP
ncbi:MAG: helix-turn-helix transcriptional regulator [Lachnospiraceae bacterium]|nr:helix-turn-helix transcriptional regulator [Lachnospiraceae bacterium]